VEGRFAAEDSALGVVVMLFAAGDSGNALVL